MGPKKKKNNDFTTCLSERFSILLAQKELPFDTHFCVYPFYRTVQAMALWVFKVYHKPSTAIKLTTALEPPLALQSSSLLL